MFVFDPCSTRVKGFTLMKVRQGWRNSKNKQTVEKIVHHSPGSSMRSKHTNISKIVLLADQRARHNAPAMSNSELFQSILFCQSDL